jgi:hypothetical protein
MFKSDFVMIIRWKDNLGKGFTNYSLLNNYLRIILKLLRFIHYFIIIKIITIFYIFILKISLSSSFRFGFTKF